MTIVALFESLNFHTFPKFPINQALSSSWDGKKINAYFNELRANESIEAFWVKDMFFADIAEKFERVDPGSPHITISHSRTFKPGNANTMFEKPISKQTDCRMLEGRIKWISYEKEAV